jgi:outer membrane protein assembly factor BamB
MRHSGKLVVCHFLVSFLAWSPSQSARADFAFVHISDTHVTADEKPGSPAHRDSAMFRELSALDPKPAFLANTGDVCEAGTPDEYEVFRRVVKENLTLPIYSAPGNHDSRWNPLGKEGFTRGTGQALYQSWDYENVHFVLLDATVTLQHWGHFDRAMLDWLDADLKKIGTDRPVVIGMHHWLGRGAAAAIQIDNEHELLERVAPYNVRLWIIGHGHSDIEWDIEGTPAIMTKGLYQGSYNLVQVTKDEMRIRRRSNDPAAEKKDLLAEEGKAAPVPNSPAVWTDVMTIPLRRQAAVPKWEPRVSVDGDTVKVSVELQGAKLQCRLNNGKPVPMGSSKTQPTQFEAELSATDLPPGEHVLTVRALEESGRTYQRRARVTISRPGNVAAIWTTDVGGAVQGHLTSSGKTVYVPTLAGELVALDTATGKPRWRFKTGGQLLSTPHVDADTVYFGSADHHVYAVNIIDGSQRWKTKTGGAVLAGASTAQGIVCIGSADTKIYGLDQRDGAVRWTVQGGSLFQSKVATDGKAFFVGGWDMQFRALNATNGDALWKHRFGRSFYYSPAISSPVVSDGRVFVSSNDGVLHSVEINSGKIFFEQDGLKSGYSTPTVVGDHLYTGSLDGRLYCLGISGKTKLWDVETVGTTYDSSPIIHGENVYIAGINGNVMARSIVDGKMRWRYQLVGGHVFSTPATDGSHVFFASMNGTVTALPAAGAN